MVMLESEKKRKAKKGKKSFASIFILLLIAIAFCSLVFGYDTFNNLRYPIKYESEVESASQRYELDKALIYGIIRTESGFRSDAVSRVNAIGLMQMMPKTLHWLQSENSDLPRASEDDLKKPDINITYGCCYMRYLIDLYGSKSTAIAAYNAGPGNVSRWLENPEYSSDGITLSRIPFDETRKYVSKVIAAEEMYNKLYFNEE